MSSDPRGAAFVAASTPGAEVSDWLRRFKDGEENGGMPGPQGFEYSLRGSDVVITHHGQRATVLRGDAANRSLAEVERDDPQLLMARATGQYKRGNEKTARNHPRNRKR